MARGYVRHAPPQEPGSGAPIRIHRSRMSFQPRGGISEGVVASRPRPSSSVVAREPADNTLDRSPPPGRRYSIAAAAAIRATAGKRARPSEREASVSARLLRNIDFTDHRKASKRKETE